MARTQLDCGFLGNSWGCLPLTQRLVGLGLFVLFQTPCYLIAWLQGLMQLPLVLWKGQTATDRAIIEFLENTMLSMYVEPVDMATGLWKLEVKSCQLVMAGKPLKSFCLLYRTNRRRRAATSEAQPPIDSQVVSFTRNGDIVTSRRQIYSTIFLWHSGSAHTKSHVLANGLVQQLVAAQPGLPADVLAPCAYNTVPLHIFLVHTPFSPAAHSWISRTMLYDARVAIASVVAESTNMDQLLGHSDKVQQMKAIGTPVANFLVDSREALRKVLQAHGISTALVSFEALWLHTVAHAVDHVAVSSQILANTTVPSGNLLVSTNPWVEGGLLDFAAGYMFSKVFAAPVLSPFASNRVADLACNKSLVTPLTPRAQAFWRDLYMALRELNAELADHVTASIMY